MAKRKAAIAEVEQERVLGFLLDLAKKADMSDEATAECFMDAEAVIDAYQAAVEEKSSNIPSRENIGIACFWLLFLTQTFVPGPCVDLVIRLLSPSNGISLYSSLESVLDLRQQALSALEAMLTQRGNPASYETSPLSDDLF